MSAPAVRAPLCEADARLAAPSSQFHPVPAPDRSGSIAPEHVLPIASPLADIEDLYRRIARWAPDPPADPWPGVVDALEHLATRDERLLALAPWRTESLEPAHLEEMVRSRELHEALRQTARSGPEEGDDDASCQSALGRAIDAAPPGKTRAGLVARHIVAHVAQQQAFAQCWVEETEECVRTLADLHAEWSLPRSRRRAWPLLEILQRATLARLAELDEIALTFSTGMRGTPLHDYAPEGF